MQTLKTNRLVLRGWDDSDAEVLIAIANQPHVDRWLPDWRDSEDWVRDWIPMVRQHGELNDPLTNFIGWAITLAEGGKIIGSINAGRFDKMGDAELGLGYFIDEGYAGRGYMTEAVVAVANHLFTAYGQDHIIATIQPCNLPSMRVAEKAGFRYVDTIEILDNGQTEVLPFRYYRLDQPRAKPQQPGRGTDIPPLHRKRRRGGVPITFRSYTGEPFFTDDYRRVRELLIRINAETLTHTNFTWSRWEWATTHGMLDTTALSRNGLWEEDGTLVAIAIYECQLGDSYFMVAPGYEHLKSDMLDHALAHLSRDGKLRAMIDNSDREFQRIARGKGLRPTQDRECEALLDIHDGLTYRLPEGFHIISMADGWDYYKYHRCMWRGFNHEGEPDSSDEAVFRKNHRRQMLSSPMINPDLVLAVVAPDGEYAAHCGMWYRPGDDYACVEPVCTQPQYRRMGLGRAAVLEGALRCGALGAKQALVGSSQQFYCDIGFDPVSTGTFWEAMGV